ncbi:MAG: guanylate kinase [Candidatus Marinimicrobia bacterium]|jgi:guanylate kinase|nr:guanylate kinase [Candidatus Neomarinimicrobiota bacterium]MDP6936003.1 guanylate kinase [Candidatus Neomarinimicrobiota bacterium]
MGKLIVLSAPSGTGKTSVCKQLLKNNPIWKFSVSATTRPLREGEVDGKDYIHMSNEKFEHNVKFGDFLEWEWVHGNKYGTPIGPLEDVLDDGGTMLLDIDVKGGKTVMEEFPENTVGIFIEPPGDDVPEQLEILEERLESRGNEPSKLIKQRLKRFPVEMEYKEDFQFHFINEDLKETVKNIEKVIKENIK